jgi:hypothetical protein
MYSDLWPPVQVFVDWDGTLTKRDTLEEVAKIGYKRNPTSRPWREVVEAYLNDYRAHQESYSPPKEQRKTVREESAWLQSLSDVENRSVSRVQEAGLFRGVDKNDVLDAAAEAIETQSVELRDGWKDLFFSELSQHGDPQPALGRDGFRFHILSVNWSGTFIKGCIRHAVMLMQSQSEFAATVPMTTLANEIASVERSTDGLDKEDITVRTSADKVRILKNTLHSPVIRPDWATKDPITVYVGDSATDFDALLRVDFGICIRDEPQGSGQRELANTFQRVGVSVKSVSKLQDPLQALQGSSKTVWWAKDLKEVSDALTKIVGTVKDWE